MLFKADRLIFEAAAKRPVFGLDTSLPIASLAILSGGKITATLNRPVASHGAALPGAMGDLLRSAGIGFRDLGAIAVGTGPGSFTGLRIGIAYAKGIAAATGCALVGTPSFDATTVAVQKSENLREDTLICPIIDARKHEVYCALYRTVPDGLEKVLEESVVTLEDLVPRVAGDVIFAGDAKAAEAAGRLAELGRAANVVDYAAIESRGAYIAALGAARLARVESASAALEPMYIRPADAIFRPASKRSPDGSTEGIWSKERKNSFSSI